MRTPYEYAIIQAVPRIERGELINVGVVLYNQRLDFLAARTHLHEERLRCLDPQADRSEQALVALQTDTSSSITKRIDCGSERSFIIHCTLARPAILGETPIHAGCHPTPTGARHALR